MILRKVFGITLLVLPYIFIMVAFEVTLVDLNVLFVLTILNTVGLLLGVLSLKIYRLNKIKISYWYITFVILIVSFVMFLSASLFVSGWDAFGLIIISLVGVLFIDMIAAFYLLIYDNKLKE